MVFVVAVMTVKVGQGDKVGMLLYCSLVFVGWFFCLWLFVLGCLFRVAC